MFRCFILNRMSEFALYLITFCCGFYISHPDTLCRRALTCRCSCRMASPRCLRPKMLTALSCLLAPCAPPLLPGLKHLPCRSETPTLQVCCLVCNTYPAGFKSLSPTFSFSLFRFLSCSPSLSLVLSRFLSLSLALSRSLSLTLAHSLSLPLSLPLFQTYMPASLP